MRERRRVRAFTLIDVLVTIFVVAVLVAIMLPSMSAVRESTRRVLCGSNVRQITIGIAMYADDHRGALPSSAFGLQPQTSGSSKSGASSSSTPMLTKMDSLRISRTRLGQSGVVWDGLGLLYSTEVLTAPKLFYCPSQRGVRGYESVSQSWLSPTDEIRGNYHYRGMGPGGERTWWQIEGKQIAVVSDSLASRDSLNHPEGFNFARADTSVAWFVDSGNRLGGSLPSAAATGGGDNGAIDGMWGQFDGR